jgi:hypothetical protein
MFDVFCKRNGASGFVGGYSIDVMAEYRYFNTVEHGERKTLWNTVREEKRRGAALLRSAPKRLELRRVRAPVNATGRGVGLPHKKEVVLYYRGWPSLEFAVIRRVKS